MQVALTEALLRRKELQAKVDQLKTIKASQVFEIQAKRVKVTDSIDELTANVPKLTASQVTAEYDYYAKALRVVDAAIQRANWQTQLDLPAAAMAAFDEKVPWTSAVASQAAAEPQAAKTSHQAASLAKARAAKQAKAKQAQPEAETV